MKDNSSFASKEKKTVKYVAPKGQSRWIYALIIVVLLVLRYTGALDMLQKEKAQVPQYGIPVELIRVVDGDTLIIRYKAEKTRCRLIGIDAPESVEDNPERITEEGKYASRFLKAFMEQYKGNLFVELDEEEFDHHGRLLAYIWLEDLMLNEYLCKEGMAYAKKYPPNLKHQHILESAMNYAKENKLGIWAEK